MYWPEIFLGPGNTALREIYSLPAGPVRQNPVVYLPAVPARPALNRGGGGGEQLRAQVSIQLNRVLAGLIETKWRISVVSEFC
jgi:hypothetical protein